MSLSIALQRIFVGQEAGSTIFFWWYSQSMGEKVRQIFFELDRCHTPFVFVWIGLDWLDLSSSCSFRYVLAVVSCLCLVCVSCVCVLWVVPSFVRSFVYCCACCRLWWSLLPITVFACRAALGRNKCEKDFCVCFRCCSGFGRGVVWCVSVRVLGSSASEQMSSRTLFRCFFFKPSDARTQLTSH